MSTTTPKSISMLVIICMLIISSSQICAQSIAKDDQDESNAKTTTAKLPVLAQKLTNLTVHVPDGGHFISGGKILNPYVANPHFSIFKNKGVTTYEFKVDGQPWKFVINPDGSMDVRYLKRFDADNLDQLRSLHPEIARRFEEFPKQTDAATKVLLTLELQLTVSVMSPSQLENLYPELYQVYSQQVVSRSFQQR